MNRQVKHLGIAALVLSTLALGTLGPAVAAPGGGGGSNTPDTPRSEPRSSQQDRTYADAVALIKAEKFAEAIPLLEQVVTQLPGHANALNFLGYCHRKLRNFDQALVYYTKALEADSRHLGAHEYLGELYLMQNNLPKAEEMLRKLRALCPAGCEQRDMLEESVAAYRKANPAQ